MPIATTDAPENATEESEYPKEKSSDRMMWGSCIGKHPIMIKAGRAPSSWDGTQRHGYGLQLETPAYRGFVTLRL
jgi:hypothetical protein